MSSHKDDTPKPSPSKRSERSASVGEYRGAPLQLQSLSDVLFHSSEEQNLFQEALDSRPHACREGCLFTLTLIKKKACL